MLQSILENRESTSMTRTHTCTHIPRINMITALKTKLAPLQEKLTFNCSAMSYLCKYVGTSNAKTLLKSNVQTLDNNKSHHENKYHVTNITASCHCEPQQSELKKVPCENENYLQTVYTGITAAQQEESSAGLTLLISVY